MKPIKTLLCFFAIALNPLLLISQAEKGDPIAPRITLFDANIAEGDPEELFNSYSNELSELDIIVSKPDSYRSVRMGAESRNCFFRDNGDGIFYCVGLQSHDDNAVILLPTMFLNFGVQSLQQAYHIENELRRYNCNDTLDINPLIEIVAQNDMSKFSNADTAVVYSFDLDSPYIPYMNRYNHCVGVYLRKYGHPSMMVKLLLNDEGLKDKERYMRQMLDGIHFGDMTTPLTPYEKTISSNDLEFPAKKSYNKPSPDRSYGLSESVKARWKAESDSLDLLPWMKPPKINSHK